MISVFFWRRPRLLGVAVVLILAAGLRAYFELPRLEDPVLRQRVGIITSAWPGADLNDVDQFLTAPIEQSLKNLTGIRQITSRTRDGVSLDVIELDDEITDVDAVWSRVREELKELAQSFPEGAKSPVLEVFPMKAFAAILAVRLPSDSPEMQFRTRAKITILEQAIRQIPGTESITRFGDPGEEIAVTVPTSRLFAGRFTPHQIAKEIQDHLPKIPPGRLKSGTRKIPLEFEDQHRSLTRLGHIEIESPLVGTDPTRDDRGKIRLDELAEIERRLDPNPDELALVDGDRVILLGVHVRNDEHVDRWSDELRDVLSRFVEKNPESAPQLIFTQELYVARRFQELLKNLAVAAGTVIVVIVLMMGWQSAVVVGAALPLSVFLAFVGLEALGIPIQQMSMTGLVIALGLLIDNAIVVVEECRKRLLNGDPPTAAIQSTVSHLALPLFGATTTTTLAFLPIALLPGPSGEFVGTLAVSVILAINASLCVALLLIPAMTVAAYRGGNRTTWNGLTVGWIQAGFRGTLRFFLRFPVLGGLLGLVLPVLGVGSLFVLPKQFFPPSERNQIQIEIELSGEASLDETQLVANRVSKILAGESGVTRVSWMLGRSAPSFYYNVIPRRLVSPNYGHAWIDLEPDTSPRKIVPKLQEELTEHIRDARCVVRLMGQGPPIDAPIEIQIQGLESRVLRELGQSVRQVLAETPGVIATRVDLQDPEPRFRMRLNNETLAELGLNRRLVASQLFSLLEGATAGTISQGPEHLPIRVETPPPKTPTDFLGWEIQNPNPPNVSGPRDSESEGGIPINAIADYSLVPQSASRLRVNAINTNLVKADLKSDLLPAAVQQVFKERLKDSDFELPPGYELSFAGESAARTTAESQLIANAIVLILLAVVVVVLCLNSLRSTAIIAIVGALSFAMGPATLQVFGFPLGFMSILGILGLMGVAVNDAIVVMAALKANDAANRGEIESMIRVVEGSARHVFSTTLTTMAGFLPILLGGGDFWPPLAAVMVGGICGATLLALYFVPCCHRLCRRSTKSIH